jgi:hypothetical protein
MSLICRILATLVLAGLVAGSTTPGTRAENNDINREARQTHEAVCRELGGTVTASGVAVEGGEAHGYVTCDFPPGSPSGVCTYFDNGATTCIGWPEKPGRSSDPPRTGATSGTPRATR